METRALQTMEKGELQLSGILANGGDDGNDPSSGCLLVERVYWFTVSLLPFCSRTCSPLD
jgi:hypothetical protein